MNHNDPHHLRALLERALAGDVQAWNDFFAELRRYLHAELCRVGQPGDAGRLDHSALVQSTLRRVWERIETQFPNGVEEQAIRRFLAWVKKIVLNRRYEELRKQWRRPAAGGSHLVGVTDLRCHSEKRERAAVELSRALARLSEKKRQVVELFWFDRLSDAEISARVGCSAAAVRVLRFRALRELRSPELLALLEE
jgi:RNA polymerase sigma factor (sigma-70 family)